MFTNNEIFKEKRIENLEYVTQNILKVCSENDLRFGQMISILERTYNFDLFSVENDKLNEYFIDYLSKNQNLIHNEKDKF